MSLREQIEALEPEHDERAPGWYFDGWYEAHVAVLDIIDRHEPPPGTRLVLMGEGFLETMDLRTGSGYRLTAEWGEPDEHGWYTPTFTAHYDQPLLPDRDALIAALWAVMQEQDAPIEVSPEWPDQADDIIAALEEQP